MKMKYLCDGVVKAKQKFQRSVEHKNLILSLADIFQFETYVHAGLKKANADFFNSMAKKVGVAYAVDQKPMKFVQDRSNVFVQQMPFDLFINTWDHSIDLMFIDGVGGDRCNQIMGIVDLALPYLKTQTGLMLIHDTFPVRKSLLSSDDCSDAWQVAKIIREGKKYKDFESLTLPGPWHGLTIIRYVGKEHLPFSYN